MHKEHATLIAPLLVCPERGMWAGLAMYCPLGLGEKKSKTQSDPTKPQAKGPIFYSSSIVPGINSHPCQYQDAFSLNLCKVPQRGLHISIPGPKTQAPRNPTGQPQVLGVFTLRSPGPVQPSAIALGLKTQPQRYTSHITLSPHPSASELSSGEVTDPESKGQSCTSHGCQESCSSPWHRSWLQASRKGPYKHPHYASSALGPPPSLTRNILSPPVYVPSQ